MDEAKYLPVLMTAAGGVLQWLRQFKTFREWHYHVIAVVLGVSAYWLVNPFGPDVRIWALSCIEFLSVGGGMALIWGGTFIVSNGARAVAASSLPDAVTNSVAVPVTNSK